MIKHYITVCLLALFCAFSISQLSAQEKKEIQKVVVIEKTIDEDGNVVEKKIVKEGKDAKAFLESNENNVWITEEGEEINLNGKDVKFTKKEAYKIIKLDEEGNREVIEWTGEGEMPDELKEAMEEHDIQINVEVEEEEGEDRKHEIKIIKKGDSADEEIELEFSGDEVPDDIKEMLEKEGINLKMLNGDDEHAVFIYEENDEQDDIKEQNSNKAKLGVFIRSDDNGVKVNGVMENSAAEKAGILEGDVLTWVNDSKVTSMKELVDALSGYAPNDKVTVSLFRDGDIKTFEVILQKREESFEHKSWNEVMEIHEEHKNGNNENDEEKEVIKKKIKIKKQK